MKGINKITLIVVSLILILPCLVSSKVNPTVTTTQNQDPILFLHGSGTGDSSTSWQTMKSLFQANGWPGTTLYAYAFDNPTDCSVQGVIGHATQIKQWVDEILATTGATKIDLVSLGQGGLSSRYYIKFLGGTDKVDDYVSLISPHHGDPNHLGEGCFVENNSLILDLNEGDETPGGFLNDTIGDRLDPIYGYIYNSTHIPGNINYTSIWGSDYGYADVWGISPFLDGAKNIKVADTSLQSPIHFYQFQSIYKLVRAAVDNFNITFPLTPPQSLRAAPGDGKVTLNWEEPMDDGGSDIIEYKIYRATSSGGPYTLIGNTSTLSYKDNTVTNGEEYYYVVTAVTSIGESGYSKEMSAIPMSSTTTTTTTTNGTNGTATFGWSALLSLFVVLLFRLRRRQS